ncbi:hypothetical protein ACP4OV_020148 [Aristida adscensionis]
MDVEGSDGIERGEEDTTFEKKSALFSLMVSDAILFNMLLNDIDRVNGAQVNVQVERAKLEPHKTRLIVVVRDYYMNKPPAEMLKQRVMTTVERVWASIDTGREGLPLYRVEVVLLPHKIYREEEFKLECLELKDRFASGSFYGLRQNKVAASGFAFSAENIWDMIQQNRHLDIPSQWISISYTLCNRLKSEILNSVGANEEYIKLMEDAPPQPEMFYGAKYDAETYGLDQDIKTETKQALHGEILQCIQPVCASMLKRYADEVQASSWEILKREVVDGVISSTLNASIDQCLEKFDDDFSGLCKYYKTFVLEQRNTITDSLLAAVEQRASKQKMIKVGKNLLRVAAVVASTLAGAGGQL